MSFDGQQIPTMTFRGREVRLTGIICNECDNDFFVHDQPEHQPKFCPYCGIRFRDYVDPDGTPRKLNGAPL